MRAQAEGRSGLQTVGLPRWREERPAHSVGEREVRFDAPGVLPIELVRVEPIVALHGSALSTSGTDDVAVFVEVIIGHNVGDHSVQSEEGTIVLRGGLRLGPAIGSVPKRGRGRVHGIQAAGGAGEADGGCPIGSSEAEVAGVEITGSGVAGEVNGSAEL